MQVQTINNTSFGRKPNRAEMAVYTKSLNQGLKLLNKQIDIIIHNAAAPSESIENIGIGSLFSRTSQKKLIPFLKSHGITGIQQEPNGLRKLGDPSPYAPESSAKNIFMIPLEKLTTRIYDCILPFKFFTDVVRTTYESKKVDYKRMNKIFDRALKIAYENAQKEYKWMRKFEEFKSANKDKLEKAAIYHILDKQYGTHWKNWKGIDKNLYSPKDSRDAAIAEKRIAVLKDKYQDEIDFFIFKQMLVEMENNYSNFFAKRSGVKIIGDSPVASPAADEWINQHLFMKDKAIGCPPDYFSKDGQRWGFGYFKPEKIFNPDGTLGEAGKILKQKYEEYFASFPGGLRIDHVIGLIDPFIYSTKSPKMTHRNSGRIYSEGKYKKTGSEYSDILRKIILKSANKYDLNKKNIICENLGDPNKPTDRVMRELGLSGISVTQFDHRGSKAPERNVIMIGSHDNQSLLEYVDNLFQNISDKHFLRKTKLLARDTAPKGATKEEVKEYCQNIRQDKKKFIAASFAELFTSPARRVQIFFTDFWGIGKTYNRPGTNKGNWELRIGENFEKDYYDAVSQGKAPNLAQAVAAAIRQRGLAEGNEKLLKDLDKSSEILNEQEPSKNPLSKLFKF